MAELEVSDHGALREALLYLSDPNIRMPQTPRLVDDLDVFEMPEGLGIQFRGGVFPIVIRGSAAAVAWNYLRGAMDGRTAVDDLVAAAPTQVGRHAIVKLLSLLHGKGLLQQGEPLSTWPAGSPMSRQVLFWGRHLGIAGNAGSGSEVQQRLATARVLLVGSGLLALSIVDLLHRSGVGAVSVIDAALAGQASDWAVAHGGRSRCQHPSMSWEGWWTRPPNSLIW